MVLKGEVNLDDPVEIYLPSTVKLPSRNGKKITLKQLANHTSGLPRNPTNINSDAYNPYRGYTKEKMYDFLNTYSLPRDPGADFEYSFTGYGLLGHIIGSKSSSNYETAINTRVIKPLSMDNTSITFTQNQLNKLAPGHNGNITVESWSKYMQDIAQGTGGLNSNLDDMLIFLEANMGKPGPLHSAMELSHQLTKTVNDKVHYMDGIGLGWNLFTMDGQNIIWKNGLNGGYSSFIGFNKANQTGVVILFNSSLNPDFFQTQMGFEILKKIKDL